MNKALTVDLNTAHEGMKIPRKLFVAYVLVAKITFLSVGIWLGYYLCQNCLHSKDCNPIVVGYLTITSLACFINCGLPIEKLSSISLS